MKLLIRKLIQLSWKMKFRFAESRGEDVHPEYPKDLSTKVNLSGDNQLWGFSGLRQRIKWCAKCAGVQRAAMKTYDETIHPQKVVKGIMQIREQLKGSALQKNPTAKSSNSHQFWRVSWVDRARIRKDLRGFCVHPKLNAMLGIDWWQKSHPPTRKMTQAFRQGHHGHPRTAQWSSAGELHVILHHAPFYYFPWNRQRLPEKPLDNWLWWQWQQQDNWFYHNSRLWESRQRHHGHSRAAQRSSPARVYVFWLAPKSVLQQKFSTNGRINGV